MTAATDDFSTFTPGLNSPGARFFAVTPSDTVDMPHVSRALFVSSTDGATCTVVAQNLQGDSATFCNVPCGTILDIRASRVLATGTGSNAAIVALW